MGAPQRYSDGVTNIGKGKTLSEMPMLDPTKVYGYFDDFFAWTAADWVMTSISATEVVSDTVAGGAVVVTTTGTSAGDGLEAQLSKDGGTNDSETFYFATGKKAWFKTRFKGSDVSDGGYMAGLHILDATPYATRPSDGIWFMSMNDSEEVDLYISKGSSETITAGICTMSDNTFVSLGFYWDGVTTIHYFVNDVEIGSVGVGTSLPDDEYLALSFCFYNAAAAAGDTMTVDYIGAWMER